MKSNLKGNVHKGAVSLDDKNNYLSWILAVFLVLSVLIDGFFAPVEYLLAVIVFIAAVILACLRQGLQNGKHVIVLCSAFILFVFLSAWMGIDRGQALYEAYKYLLYILIFIAALPMSVSDIERFYLLIFATGVLSALIGLTAMGTDLFISHAMGGQRLQGTFAYANTTAIYLLINIMLGIYLGTQARGYRRMLFIAGAFICAVTLFLTGSRTVWLMWPLGVLLSIIMAPDQERIYWAGMGTIIGLGGVGAGYGTYVLYIGEKIALAYLLLFATLLIVTAAVYLFQDVVQQRFSSRVKLFWFNIVILMLGLMTGIILMGTATGRSLAWNVSELQGRLIYYADACSIIKDHPWLGVGGGGWASIQYLYQTAYYDVSLVHNSILQIALDSGIPGLLLFLALLVLVIVHIWRGRNILLQGEQYHLLNPALLGGLLFFGHSVVDVDMAFPGAAGIFFFFLAVPFILLPASYKPGNISLDKAGVLLSSAGKWVAIFLLSLLLIGAALLWEASYYELRGDKSAHVGNTMQAINFYQKSVEIFPFMARTFNQMGMAQEQAVLTYEQEEFQDVAYDSYSRAHRLNPYQPRYLENLACTGLLLGKYDQSVEYFEVLCHNNPMVVRNYENLAHALITAGERQGDAGKEYYHKVLEIPAMIENARARVCPQGWELRDIPQLELTMRLSWQMGQAEYHLGHLEQAHALWRSAAQDPEILSEMRRWAIDNKVDLKL